MVFPNKVVSKFEMTRDRHRDLAVKSVQDGSDFIAIFEADARSSLTIQHRLERDNANCHAIILSCSIPGPHAR